MSLVFLRSAGIGEGEVILILPLSLYLTWYKRTKRKTPQASTFSTPNHHENTFDTWQILKKHLMSLL